MTTWSGTQQIMVFFAAITLAVPACGGGSGEDPDATPPAPDAGPSCTNGVLDGAETDVDCGSVCGPCADGAMCGAAADCASGVCSAGTCAAPACGDGVVTASEACDDGNAGDGDGCDTNCTLTACGNGVVSFGEACDDGNAADGDGCDTNCTPTACGNGVVSFGEVCDDGNAADGDGCDTNCTPTACGNGVLTAGEECDDGNVLDGDGCDADCTLATVVPGFTGDVGPDLSAEGYQQCYGWHNDGINPTPLWASIHSLCGAGTRVVFAGFRCTGEWVRHDVDLGGMTLDTYVPATYPGSASQPLDASYKLDTDNIGYILLSDASAGWWSMRYWEVGVTGGVAAYEGHVLTEDWMLGPDQAFCTGDRYFIYVQ